MWNFRRKTRWVFSKILGILRILSFFLYREEIPGRYHEAFLEKLHLKILRDPRGSPDGIFGGIPGIIIWEISKVTPYGISWRNTAGISGVSGGIREVTSGSIIRQTSASTDGEILGENPWGISGRISDGNSKVILGKVTKEISYVNSGGILYAVPGGIFGEIPGEIPKEISFVIPGGYHEVIPEGVLLEFVRELQVEFLQEFLVESQVKLLTINEYINKFLGYFLERVLVKFLAE